jgi:invasion protein IalB
MIYRIASAASGPASRRLAALTHAFTGALIGALIGRSTRVLGLGMMAAVALALACGSHALAQTQTEPTPKPKVHKPKSKSENHQAGPAAEPQQAQPHPVQAQNGQQQVQLIFSPWTKFCLKGQPGQPVDPNAKQVCFTGKDARVESGQPVAAAVLIEPQGQDRKILRITLPLGMQLVHGTRLIVDQNTPMTAPYVICFTNGCMADYEASADLINKLKKGKGLVLQAINATGQPISLVMPLNDFAKAYEGAPTDPKVFEEQQRKLQEELQHRADEARKKLESQQGMPTSSAAPPAKTQ